MRNKKLLSVALALVMLFAFSAMSFAEGEIFCDACGLVEVAAEGDLCDDCYAAANPPIVYLCDDCGLVEVAAEGDLCDDCYAAANPPADDDELNFFQKIMKWFQELFQKIKDFFEKIFA